MAAFRAALDSPADAMELDLQLSRDGTPMVFHDRTLERVGHGAGRLLNLNRADLQGLDAGSWLDDRFAGERIPTLREVLSTIGTLPLLLECKIFDDDIESGVMRQLVRAVMAAVREAHAVDRVMILSFSSEALHETRRRCPDVRTVLNLRAPPTARDDLLALIRDVDAVDVDVEQCSQSAVAPIHAVGKPLLTYTCNTVDDVSAALALGVQGIITDCPAFVRSTLDALP